MEPISGFIIGAALLLDDESKRKLRQGTVKYAGQGWDFTTRTARNLTDK